LLGLSISAVACQEVVGQNMLLGMQYKPARSPSVTKYVPSFPQDALHSNGTLMERGRCGHDVASFCLKTQEIQDSSVVANVTRRGSDCCQTRGHGDVLYGRVPRLICRATSFRILFLERSSLDGLRLCRFVFSSFVAIVSSVVRRHAILKMMMGCCLTIRCRQW
jgi:hypothetical protein